MAFFPCIYFESLQMCYFQDECVNLTKQGKPRYDIILDRIGERTRFHKLLYQLYAIAKINGFRLIIENPATAPHYLIGTQNFPKPTFIDRNRALRGDYFKKPTAYWFVNIERTFGETLKVNKKPKLVSQMKRGKGGGICSEERSMISPTYARLFIKDFILGKHERGSQLSLFD